MAKILVNADDFGISRGVNSAIKNMFNNKKLNSASIFANAKYTQDAIDFCKKNKDLRSGLHFNLTTGASVLGHKQLPDLTDIQGNFKFGFIGLLLNVLFNKNVLQQIENELNAQLDKISELPISHIDGHRHVHFLPRIFAITQKVAIQRKINRVRVINESIIHSLINYKKISFLFDGGLIKLLILKTCGMLNGSRRYKSKYYMFSILYTCKITNDLLKNFSIPRSYESCEIMVHPGNPDIDKTDEIRYEKDQLLNQFRHEESKVNILANTE